MTTTLSLAYSQPSVYDGPAGRVHHGYSTAKATESEALDVSDGRWPVSAHYAKLEPGGFIVPHVDQGPWRERWHYPISGVGYVWQVWGDSDVELSEKAWRGLPAPPVSYRMNHHKPHAVWNPWSNLPEPRVILIVEYDNPVDQPTTDLIICPMIPQVQEMIDALR